MCLLRNQYLQELIDHQINVWSWRMTDSIVDEDYCENDPFSNGYPPESTLDKSSGQIDNVVSNDDNDEYESLPFRGPKLSRGRRQIESKLQKLINKIYLGSNCSKPKPLRLSLPADSKSLGNKSFFL